MSRRKPPYRATASVDPESRSDFYLDSAELERIGVHIPDGDRPVAMHGTAHFRDLCPEDEE